MGSEAEAVVAATWHNCILFLDGESCCSVLSVDQHPMIIADADEPRIDRYVCPTEAENIECERLPEYHSRPSQCILLSLWSK
jgi:hypothetical protein